MKEAGILHGDGDVRAESLEKAELRLAEGVEVVMGGAEDADQFTIHLKRDGDLGAGGGLAGNVIGVETDVRGIVQLTRGGNVSSHALFANFQTMAAAEHRAAANTRQHEFVLLSIVKIKIDFDGVERVGNFLYQALDDFVEVEGRGDALGGFLQAHQLGNPMATGVSAENGLERSKFERGAVAMMEPPEPWK